MTQKNTTQAFSNATIKVRDLVEGYINNTIEEEGGITTMNGRLNILPKYQRVYNADIRPMWRENLIDSILCGFPINRVYIGVCDDGTYEMIDGQRRTRTICEFVKGNFSITKDGGPYYFHNLSKEEQELILDYPLDVTYCIGSESVRVAWFKRLKQSTL